MPVLFTEVEPRAFFTSRPGHAPSTRRQMQQDITLQWRYSTAAGADGPSTLRQAERRAHVLARIRVSRFEHQPSVPARVGSSPDSDSALRLQLREGVLESRPALPVVDTDEAADLELSEATGVGTAPPVNGGGLAGVGGGLLLWGWAGVPRLERVRWGLLREVAGLISLDASGVSRPASPDPPTPNCPAPANPESVALAT